MPSAGPVRVPIADDADIVAARRIGREFAARAGCSDTDSTLVAAAISEVARNITIHAGRGEVRLSVVVFNGRDAVEVIAHDEGPGIPDIVRAMEDGYSTGTGLGRGLGGARRVMDHFELTSTVGAGTTVVMRKRCRR